MKATKNTRPTNLKEAATYLRRLDRLKHPQDCANGHMDCAAWNAGPCKDELLAAYPELED